MKFKPGDEVKYKGLTVDSVVTGPCEGKLVLYDSNTTIKGVMQIEGDSQGMMFCPDGTIYCHSQHGCLLTKKRKPKENTC